MLRPVYFVVWSSSYIPNFYYFSFSFFLFVVLSEEEEEGKIIKKKKKTERRVNTLAFITIRKGKKKNLIGTEPSFSSAMRMIA
jgi:hypothetical protein